jgi:hypothetical protein
VLKLMTLAASPVGIDEARRSDAIPRRLYDLDILLASFVNSGRWEAMVAYCSARYARECEPTRSEQALLSRVCADVCAADGARRPNEDDARYLTNAHLQRFS